MRKLKWGVLSTANIGVAKVIPAMQAGNYCNILGIASRSEGNAKEVAEKLSIEKWYGSYEDLLNDDEIEAVYIPLPNDLHVPYALKAIEANKHVLCEKPIALSAAEANKLLEAAQNKPHLKVMEAFMYKMHPQWLKAKSLVDEGAIGDLKTVHSFFSYFNADAQNIRNDKTKGGGALMDIGCYCISLSRFLFNDEPINVMAQVELDPQFNTDRLTLGMLQFNKGTASFTCATQCAPYQRVLIYGTTGFIEIEIPFNAPPDKPTKLWLRSTSTQEFEFDVVNQYTLQGDLFSLSVLNNTPVPETLNDAVQNMKVIEAIFASTATGTRVTVQ